LFLAFSSDRALAGPATRPSGQIEKWVEQLADRDPSARDAARDALMGMSPADLPVLRAVLEKSQPLAPSQAGSLREVVTQVYLAGQSYAPAAVRQGFLGVMLLPLGPRGWAPADAADDAFMPGVLVGERLPGFCGFRALRLGDVVTGVRSAGNLIKTETQQSLQNAIASTPPGEAISLELLRQGRTIEVSVKVDVRPLAAEDRNPAVINEFAARRQALADDYWQTHFAALVEGEIS
jgi:hypothetical protein